MHGMVAHGRFALALAGPMMTLLGTKYFGDGSRFQFISHKNIVVINTYYYQARCRFPLHSAKADVSDS